jgi:hypothetical protein
MPFADQEMLGPNRLSGFAYGYGLFALPNVLIISAFLFALATATRSTAGTFIGVIALLVFYLVVQGLMEGAAAALSCACLPIRSACPPTWRARNISRRPSSTPALVPVTDLMCRAGCSGSACRSPFWR